MKHMQHQRCIFFLIAYKILYNLSWSYRGLAGNQLDAMQTPFLGNPWHMFCYVCMFIFFILNLLYSHESNIRFTSGINHRFWHGFLQEDFVGRVASLCGNLHKNSMHTVALKRFYLGQKSRFEVTSWDKFNTGWISLLGIHLTVSWWNFGQMHNLKRNIHNVLDDGFF